MLKPLTSSLSPSEKSKGVRLVSINLKISKMIIKTKLNNNILSKKKSFFINTKKYTKGIKTMSKLSMLTAVRKDPKKLYLDLLKKEPKILTNTKKPICKKKNKKDQTQLFVTKTKVKKKYIRITKKKPKTGENIKKK